MNPPPNRLESKLLLIDVPTYEVMATPKPNFRMKVQFG